MSNIFDNGDHPEAVVAYEEGAKAARNMRADYGFWVAFRFLKRMKVRKCYDRSDWDRFWRVFNSGFTTENQKAEIAHWCGFYDALSEEIEKRGVDRDE